MCPCDTNNCRKVKIIRELCRSMSKGKDLKQAAERKRDSVKSLISISFSALVFPLMGFPSLRKIVLS